MTTTPADVPDMGDWINLAPLRTRAVSLLRVDGNSARQAHDLEGKRALAPPLDGDLFVLWTGRYRTDARRVAKHERQALDDALN